MQTMATRSDQTSFGSQIGQRFRALVGGERFAQTQTMILFAAIFWVSTYFLFSIRSALFPPIGADLISFKRVLLTFFGAVLFLSALIGVRHFSPVDRRHKYSLIVGSSLTACSVLLLIRLAYNDLAEPYTFGVTDHARWIMVWGGYFLGGLALFSPEANVTADRSSIMLASAEERATAEALWVQRNKQLVKLPVGEIEWLEAQGNYVFAHSGGSGGLLRTSLASLEEKFEAHGFIRVHRSALCQKAHINALKRVSGGTLALILASGAEIPVGRRFAANVAAIMGD